jgi:hypothetical protein
VDPKIACLLFHFIFIGPHQAVAWLYDTMVLAGGGCGLQAGGAACMPVHATVCENMASTKIIFLIFNEHTVVFESTPPHLFAVCACLLF